MSLLCVRLRGLFNCRPTAINLPEMAAVFYMSSPFVCLFLKLAKKSALDHGQEYVPQPVILGKLWN